MTMSPLMLRISGMFLAVLGIYLIIVPPADESGIVQYLPAAMCLLFAFLTAKLWLPMVKSVDHREVLRTGESAMATIVNMRGRPPRANYYPVWKLTLELSDGDGPVRRMVTRQTMTEESAGMLNAGLEVPVRVDSNKDAVAIDWERLHEMVRDRTITPVSGGSAKRSSQLWSTADVIRDGISAQATVQSMSMTGKTYGEMVPARADASTSGDPMVSLTLEVTGDDGATFTKQGIYRVPQENLSEITPGVKLPVAYLPGNPRSTSVDWDSL